jgi:hypothetical protein
MATKPVVKKEYKGFFVQNWKSVEVKAIDGETIGNSLFCEGKLQGKVLQIFGEPVKDHNGIEYCSALVQIKEGVATMAKFAKGEGLWDQLKALPIGETALFVGAVNRGFKGGRHLRGEQILEPIEVA